MNENKESEAKIDNTTPLVQGKNIFDPKSEENLDQGVCSNKLRQKLSILMPIFFICLIAIGVGLGLYFTPPGSESKHFFFEFITRFSNPPFHLETGHFLEPCLHLPLLQKLDETNLRQE